MFDQPDQNIATAFIDGSPYRIILDTNNQLFTTEYSDEPPWSEGSPPMLSDPSYTWHLGGLKSRQGIPGTSEYGQNTDGRWAFKLYPGPKLNTFTLPASSAAPTYAFAGLGYVWVLAGTQVFRINNTTGVVTASKTNFTDNTLHGIEWEGAVYVSLVTGILWKMSAIGSPDTWTLGTGTTGALYLAKGFNRLFKIHDSNLGVLAIQNLGIGLDATDAADWADEVIAPGDATDIVAYDRTVIVNAGLADGIYAVGEEGFGIPQARRIHPSGKLKFVEPYIYIPHDDGLARFQPGFLEAVGLENEVMNESPVQGAVNAVAADGYWIYMAVYDGAGTYILVGRERRGSEPGLGPMVWDTLAYIATVNVSFMEVFHRGTLPGILVYNHGTNLGYILIPHTGGTPQVNSTDYRFSQSGTRYTIHYNFNDRGIKFFNQVKVKAEGVDTLTNWTLAYRIDRGDWETLDINGVTMVVDSTTLQTFFLPNTAIGVDIQFRLTYTGETDTNPGILTYFEPFAIPRSRRILGIKCTLDLITGARHEDRIDRRTAHEQLVALTELLETSTPITLQGPWSGTADSAFIKNITLLQGSYNSGYEQHILADVTFQIRKSS